MICGRRDDPSSAIDQTDLAARRGGAQSAHHTDCENIGLPSRKLGQERGLAVAAGSHNAAIIATREHAGTVEIERDGEDRGSRAMRLDGIGLAHVPGRNKPNRPITERNRKRPISKKYGTGQRDVEGEVPPRRRNDTPIIQRKH
jgi:hypothetical protein